MQPCKGEERMSKLHKAAQQALEALEFMADEWGFTQKANRPERWQAIEALRAALAQQDEPKGGGNLPPPLQAEPVEEPVAWQWLNTAHFRKNLPVNAESGAWNPLYTRPPRREWRGLTEEDVAQNLRSRHDAAKLLEERRQEITQPPEALRHAQELDRRGLLEEAAELRHLHYENERLHQINQSHEMKLSVRGYEIQIADLKPREKLAHWMRSMGYATGHGDTIEDLLDHLGTQIAEGLKAEVMMEREACAKECDAVSASADKAAVDGQYLVIRNGAEARRCAAAIRARGKP
jgi:hypothetical protein